MKIDKHTNEQLLIETTKLRESHANWVSGDETRRLEFARAFNWKKPQELYSLREENEPRIPTWVEIFVELGKLLACRDFRDWEGTVSEIECKLNDLESKIIQEIHPNL